jgi:hypothetical protein
MRYACTFVRFFDGDPTRKLEIVDRISHGQFRWMTTGTSALQGPRHIA